MSHSPKQASAEWPKYSFQALPAFVWVWFQVFVFIPAEVGVVHMLRGERIIRNPRAREPVGNSSAANIPTAARQLLSEALC